MAYSGQPGSWKLRLHRLFRPHADHPNSFSSGSSPGTPGEDPHVAPAAVSGLDVQAGMNPGRGSMYLIPPGGAMHRPGGGSGVTASAAVSGVPPAAAGPGLSQQLNAQTWRMTRVGGVLETPTPVAQDVVPIYKTLVEPDKGVRVPSKQKVQKWLQTIPDQFACGPMDEDWPEPPGPPLGEAVLGEAECSR